MGDGRILEVAGLQIVTPRPVFGSSSLMRSRCFMARSKASRTDFRTEDDRASISFILSSILLMPKGAILDLGSHCQLRLLSKKWTRKSFSADLNCIRSPALRTSNGGWGRSTPLCRHIVFRDLGSMI